MYTHIEYMFTYNTHTHSRTSNSSDRDDASDDDEAAEESLVLYEHTTATAVLPPTTTATAVPPLTTATTMRLRKRALCLTNIAPSKALSPLFHEHSTLEGIVSSLPRT